MIKFLLAVSLLQYILKVHLVESKLPPYIKACSARAKDFDQCSLQHARDAIPFILKGDRKYGIPNLVPLLVPSVIIDAGKELKISLKDIEVYGLEHNDIQELKIDTSKQYIKLKAYFPRLEFIGKYNIDGKILILPITGNGKMNITTVDGEYVYEYNYSIKQIDGVEYFDLTDDDKLDFTLGRAYINLENLFNGDEKLGKQMNDFLNENWKDAVKEIGGAISETVRTLARAIASGYFQKIPYKELLLD